MYEKKKGIIIVFITKNKIWYFLTFLLVFIFYIFNSFFTNIFDFFFLSIFDFFTNTNYFSQSIYDLLLNGFVSSDDVIAEELRGPNGPGGPNGPPLDHYHLCKLHLILMSNFYTKEVVKY